MYKFNLLVNGQDLDTGLYEYFPYADKVIMDFKATYKIIASLKRGETCSDVDEYVYAKYCVGDEDTNKKAMAAAYKASQKFRYFPVSVRRKILGDIHKKLLEKKEDLLKLFVIEGHPRKLAEWEFDGMDRVFCKESVDYFKDELWSEVGREQHETIYLVRKPDGVVCVAPPKNAPCSNSVLIILTLLSGNTIVIKPPLHSPLTTIYLWKEIVWKVIKENGAPDGTINIVLGNSKKIMDEWIQSIEVNDIVFFGNSDRGLDLGKSIYAAGKKPILELSGNDSMFIWHDANLEEATDSLLDGFLGSTQICMVPKMAMIHEKIYRDFVNAFSEKVKQLKVGLPSDYRTCLTPVLMIKEFYEFLEDAKSKGAIVLQGGERVNFRGNKVDKGMYIMPTVILIENFEKALEMKCVKEENFFPLIPLVKIEGYTDEEVFRRMITVANSNEYGLRTSVWIKSSCYLRKFIRYIQNSGLLRINSRHVAFSLFLSTHGGTGRSGGPYGEMNYIWQKTSHLQGISLTREKIHIN